LTEIYDIAAGHLVASSASGDSSYLLLDQSGCPTDPGTFPALLKDPADNRSLISTFTAFKFPDSQIVRFNVIVRFCLEKCEPVSACNIASSESACDLQLRTIALPYERRKIRDSFFKTTCRGGHISYGRKRRSLPLEQPLIAEVTEVYENLTELPLQLSIVVQSPVITADQLLSRENSAPDTFLITGGSESNFDII